MLHTKSELIISRRNDRSPFHRSPTQCAQKCYEGYSSTRQYSKTIQCNGSSQRISEALRNVTLY